MSIYFGSYGFDYVQRLTNAIELYIEDSEKASKDSFDYRGVTLKYAVERELFIKYCNDEGLIKLYDDFRKGILTSEYIFDDEVNYFLACAIVSDSNNPRCDMNGRIKFIPSRLRKLKSGVVRHGLSIARSLLFKLSKKNSPDNSGGGYYFIIHDKFIRYFEPLYDRSKNNRYIFLGRKLKHHMHNDMRGIGLFLNGYPCGPLSRNSELFKYPSLLLAFDSFYAFFKECRRSYVVLPEGDAALYEVLNQACKKLGVPVICIQQGWSPVTSSRTKHMSYTKMLVWGRGFADLLSPHNPQQHFTPTGNHLVSTGSGKKLTEGKVLKEGVCFFLQVRGAFISAASWGNFIELVMWTAEHFPKKNIYVREHPSYKLSKPDRDAMSEFPNVIFASPQHYKLQELFDCCLLSVAVYSSTILESIAAGVLPIIYNEASLPVYSPDVDSAGAGIEVKNLTGAKHIISDLLSDTRLLNQYEPAMKDFAEKYFNADSKEMAIDIIESEISELLTK